MNISGIRPKQEFYAGVERREPEKKEIHRLNQVAIRMVEMPPLFSEEPMNGPAAAVKVIESEGGKGMNQKEFNEVIIRQTDRCKSMLVAKGAEYAPRAVKNTAVDRLAHFKKAAVVLNTTPRAALMGMLSKHLISVSDMCMCEQQYSKEQWDEKITDSINYFLILCAIVEEELNEEN